MADSSPTTRILAESNSLEEMGYKVAIKKPSSPVHILSHTNKDVVDMERIRRRARYERVIGRS